MIFMRAQVILQKSGERVLRILCPACGFCHGFPLDPPAHQRGKHCVSWNNNQDRPTIHGNLMVTELNADGRECRRCHFVVSAGKIAFYDDSKHEMAGRAVWLPEIN